MRTIACKTVWALLVGVSLVTVTELLQQGSCNTRRRDEEQTA